MNKRLITIIITGLIIEGLCVAIASIGDIKENIPGFSFLYTASFIVYVFAIFYVSKNAKDSKEAENAVIQYQVDNHPSSPPSQGGDKGEVIKSNRIPLDIVQLREKYSKKILWTVLIFSLIFRLTLLPATPSGDLYRYLWEGKLQLNWLNPYSLPPESSSLEGLRDSFFSGITHKHLTTIYPPLTLMVFAMADYVSHSFLSMKSAFLLFDVLTIFVIVRFLRVMGKDPINVLIYAWSPLVLISFAVKGHCDSLQIFLVVLSLYLFSIRRNLKSVISIGLAAMSKFVFIIVAPFLIPRGKLKYLAVLPLVIAILYLPYIGAGKGLFSTLLHFGTQYHYNDSAHFLIFCLSLGSPLISRIITSMIFVTVLLYLYKKYMSLLVTDDNNNPPLFRPFSNPPPCQTRPRLYQNGQANGRQVSPFSKGGYGRFREINDAILKFAFMSIGTFLILSPTVHPWYLTWIVPFLCFNNNWAWLVLTGTVVFYYFMNHNLFSTLIEYNNERVWQEVHWLKLPEYVPFYGLLIYGWLVKKNFTLRTLWLNRNFIGGRS
ncbi:MAG: hypothetical protein ACE5GU_01715 [Candidatus Scalinduaceae bacterium]